MKKSSTKKTIRNIHLWLGLSIGLLVFIISITGAIYAFQEEITNALREEAIYNTETNIDSKKTLSIAELEKKVDAFTNEKYPIHWVNIANNKNIN